MASTDVPLRPQLRLASALERMPRDRHRRVRDRRVGAAMVVASVLGLALAVANYAM